jgi:hypothetical protein
MQPGETFSDEAARELLQSQMRIANRMLDCLLFALTLLWLGGVVWGLLWP